MTAREAAVALLEAHAAHDLAVERADRAWHRWFRGEVYSGSASSRLANAANLTSAELYRAQGALWRHLPDVGSEESLREAAHVLAGVPLPRG